MAGDACPALGGGRWGSLDSLILYWSMMEQLHYPMAGTIKAELQRQKQAQEAQAAQAASAVPGAAQDMDSGAEAAALMAGGAAAEGGAAL